VGVRSPPQLKIIELLQHPLYEVAGQAILSGVIIHLPTMGGAAHRPIPYHVFLECHLHRGDNCIVELVTWLSLRIQPGKANVLLGRKVR